MYRGSRKFGLKNVQEEDNFSGRAATLAALTTGNHDFSSQYFIKIAAEFTRLVSLSSDCELAVTCKRTLPIFVKKSKMSSVFPPNMLSRPFNSIQNPLTRPINFSDLTRFTFLFFPEKQ